MTSCLEHDRESIPASQIPNQFTAEYHTTPQYKDERHFNYESLQNHYKTCYPEGKI